jgi:hypothetical protein
VEEGQGRIQYLEQSTASSQIFVGIRPVAEPPDSPPLLKATLMTTAWNASLRVLQGLANAVITAIVFIWWLVAVLLSALVGWRRWARLKRRSRHIAAGRRARCPTGVRLTSTMSTGSESCWRRSPGAVGDVAADGSIRYMW